MKQILVIVLVVVSLCLWGNTAADANFDRQILQQYVYLNVPSYRLSLYTQYTDKRWEQMTIPVAVGAGGTRKSQTPTGKGELYAKAVGVTFQYGSQNPPELVGKTITHSNTFDKHTLKPVRIKMPGDMKSIFMQVTSDIDAQFYKRYVLHETTDWYTVGAPASKGCVRIDREDMQRLYGALAPSVSSGTLESTVPITIYYDVAEYYKEQQMVVLHANIYNRNINYVQAILSDLQEAGIDTRLMNMPALLGVVQQAEQQFNQAMHTISKRLKKAPFERFISDAEKQQLHFTFFLKYNY